MRPPGSARGSRVVVSPALDRPLHPALVGSGLVLRKRLELLHRPQVRLVELDRGARGRLRLASPAPIHRTPTLDDPPWGEKGRRAGDTGGAIIRRRTRPPRARRRAAAA